MISITSNQDSRLAKASTIHLKLPNSKEACPLNLAPTTSTTTSLALGDALAVTLLDARGFNAQDFARNHPGGKLGRRLTLTVADLMHQGSDIPIVSPKTTLSEALVEITNKRLGMTIILDHHKLVGIFTDGDLRRTLESHSDIKKITIQDIMSQNPKTLPADTLAVDALQIMNNQNITSMVITDSSTQVIGIIHIHDLLQAGI